MASVRKPTKQGSLTPAFAQAAANNAEGALSYMLLAAFGVSLSTLMGICVKAITTGDAQLIIMCMTAGVQIRNHVVFVGRDFGGIRTKYPELIIEGQREQQDIFNYGALHALGHVFAHVTSNGLGLKIIEKAGSCITGEKLTGSDAGVINKEIYESWAADDKAAWGAWLSKTRTAHAAALDPIVVSVTAKARNFATALQGGPSTTAKPAPGDKAPKKDEKKDDKKAEKASEEEAPPATLQ